MNEGTDTLGMEVAYAPLPEDCLFGVLRRFQHCTGLKRRQPICHLKCYEITPHSAILSKCERSKAIQESDCSRGGQLGCQLGNI